MKFNHLTINSFDVEFFDKPNGNHTGNDGTTNYTIHVKRLQTKHLLYAEPTDDFGFYKNYPEGKAY